MILPSENDQILAVILLTGILFFPTPLFFAEDFPFSWKIPAIVKKLICLYYTFKF